MKSHHSQNSHKVYRYRILLDPLCNQLHQQHEHVVDSLVNFGAPFVNSIAGQQLRTEDKSQKRKVGEILSELHISHLEFSLLITYFFKRLWHASVHKPLAVLISVSET